MKYDVTWRLQHLEQPWCTRITDVCSRIRGENVDLENQKQLGAVKSLDC